MATIADQCLAVRARIERACAAHGRTPGSVTLLAVSKTFPAAAVLEAAEAGQRAFGENYVQEGVRKIEALRALGRSALEWHHIGPLQSNKTRAVAEHYDWVHSVERLSIAQRLSQQRPAQCAPLQVCLQVNVDGGANKAGLDLQQPQALDELAALARQVAALPHLRLRGLMCIPEPSPDFAAQCAAFARLRALLQRLQAQGLALDTLSMGMSADLEVAIASGSTLVRVGSAIFGARAQAAANSGSEK